MTPDVLLTEVTFGNQNEELALTIGHLTPRLLGEALNEFKTLHNYLPKVMRWSSARLRSRWSC